jgi:hypothetical protein
MSYIVILMSFQTIYSTVLTMVLISAAEQHMHDRA